MAARADEWWEANSTPREKAFAKLAGGHELSAAEKRLVSGAPDGWECPVPLDQHDALSEFPVQVFPPWAREFVAALAESTQTPVDLPAMMLLGALAAAAGGRAVVRARAGWTEPLNLFVAIAMAPGNRKSAVVQEVTKPLRGAERILVDDVAQEISEAKTAQSIATTKAKDLARQAAKAAVDGEVDAEALKTRATEAAAMAEAVTVPTIPRFLADDCTPEALTTLMARQAGRVAVISAEGGVFDIISGRYSKMPSFDVYLKGHAGDQILVDRVGRAPERIEQPALTLALAVQPAVLRSIAYREGFRGRGLLARFMFVIPTSFVGRRKIGAASIPNHAREEYDDTMKALVVSLAEWTDPAVLAFSDEANRALMDFERHLEPRIGEGGDLHHLADWGSKLAGATVRIAGLLHLARTLTTGYREPISISTYDSAAMVGDYLLEHAIAAHAYMGADPVIEDARVLLEWVRLASRAAPTFTKRDAHRALTSRFTKSAGLDAPLELLEDRGWIRRQPEPPVRTQGGRRASPTFEVYPAS